MIYEITMYACKCDNCGKDWIDEHSGYCAFNDVAGMHQSVQDDESWYCEGNKQYCDECFGGFDDEDNIIWKKPLKEPTAQASVASKDA